MFFRKQKQESIKRASFQNTKQMIFLNEYRSQILPTQFNLRQIQTYGSILPIEMQNIQSSTIDQEVLRQLLVDSLKLTFIYQPLMETLRLQYEHHRTHFPFKMIMRILYRGNFYRFVQNIDNQLKILINNRTTESNVKIIIAALFVNTLKKMNIEEITNALLFFSLESALYNADKIDQLFIPMDNQKIMKVLRKLQRVVKPIQFKIWLEGVKNSKDFKGQIQVHHFLYLCSVTQKKFNNGLGSIIFRPKIESLFKNVVNSKTLQIQQKQLIKQYKQEKRMVRGLSFVDIRPKQHSFSKEILKEFRLRNPSKFKRPDTALLRRHVSSYFPNETNVKPTFDEQCFRTTINTKIQKNILTKFNKSPWIKVNKKNLRSEQKIAFKLKIVR